MLLKSVGLYKVMGEGVQAIVGGTYHQFVSTSNFLSIHTYFSISSGSFCSSSVIPPTNITTLLIRGPLGLHEAYHADAFSRAEVVCEGAEGGLVRSKGES